MEKEKKTPGSLTISSFTTSLNNFNILFSDERKNVLDIMKMALKVKGDKNNMRNYRFIIIDLRHAITQ